MAVKRQTTPLTSWRGGEQRASRGSAVVIWKISRGINSNPARYILRYGLSHRLTSHGGGRHHSKTLGGLRKSVRTWVRCRVKIVRSV